MTHIANARAWLRDIPGWSEQEQEEVVRAWCAARSWRLIVYRASAKKRDLWLRALRKDEAAVLPRLDIIISLRRERQGRPSHEFARVLDQIRARAGMVVDVRYEATSEDPKSWDDALSAALRKVSSGRKTLAKKEAKAMQVRSLEARRAKSVLVKWREMQSRNTREFQAGRAIWKSRAFANAAEAHKALPDELHAISRVSLDRLFGGRT